VVVLVVQGSRELWCCAEWFVVDGPCHLHHSSHLASFLSLLSSLLTPPPAIIIIEMKTIHSLANHLFHYSLELVSLAYLVYEMPPQPHAFGSQPQPFQPSHYPYPSSSSNNSTTTTTYGTMRRKGKRKGRVMKNKIKSLHRRGRAPHLSTGGGGEDTYVKVVSIIGMTILAGSNASLLLLWSRFVYMDREHGEGKTTTPPE